MQTSPGLYAEFLLEINLLLYQGNWKKDLTLGITLVSDMGEEGL